MQDISMNGVELKQLFLEYVSVILDDGINKPLDYEVPTSLQNKLQPGSRVLVPLKKRLCKGTVVEVKKSSSVSSIQPIKEVLSETSLISKELLTLASWISFYYCAPLRKVIHLILPPVLRSDSKHKMQFFIKPALSLPKLSELCQELRLKQSSQASVLDIILKHPKGILLSELLEKSGVSKSPLDTLIKKKALIASKIMIDRSSVETLDYFQTKAKVLNEEQREALKKTLKSLDEGIFETHLLHGITGSGKTEIYLQAMAHALSLNKSILFLIPEIALTSQTIEKIQSRFKEKIAIFHHRLSHGEKYDTWHHLHRGEIKIAIGARSAVFSPLVNLGLIIIDEEQESAYKQNDENPCYHARDVAIMRAKLSQATVILGSATPSFESYKNALSGKYRLSSLRIRANEASLPQIFIVDMLREFDKKKGYTLFSDSLLQKIESRLKSGEQTLLFLNRRGFHTSQVCLKCSHVISCPHCSINLTFHKKEHYLYCHLCDYHIPPPKACPSCQSEESLKYRGAGTEQVENALQAIFPSIRTLRIDADTTRHKGSHEELLKQFRAGKADLLIGTQMIAKGLHFPNVTLVGILNADSNLTIPDFRSSEQVFQMITQVSGRSGRGEQKGEVVIQTCLSLHEIIQSAKKQDYEAFYRQEIKIREQFHYPPFTRLIRLIFIGKDSNLTLQNAQRLRSLLIPKLPDFFQIHPIIPCGHAKIKDQFRFQFLIKSEKLSPFLELFRQVNELFQLDKKVRLLIDIDPLNTYF